MLPGTVAILEIHRACWNKVRFAIPNRCRQPRTVFGALSDLLGRLQATDEGGWSELLNPLDQEHQQDGNDQDCGGHTSDDDGGQRPGGRDSDSSPGCPAELATIAGFEWVGSGGSPSTTGTSSRAAGREKPVEPSLIILLVQRSAVKAALSLALSRSRSASVTGASGVLR